MALPVASILSHITDAITAAIGDHGVYAVFLLMFVDAVLPAASELVMVYAGALAAGAFTEEYVTLFGERIESGFWAFVTMVAAGTLGYTLGAVVGWAIGVYGGRPYLDRHGRWLHLGPERLERAERWFDRWGDATALIGRIMPVARSFVSIPAGVFRQALGRYTVLTFIGSTVWCLVFASIGWAVGSNWETFHENFHYVDYAVLAAIVGGAIWLYVRRRRSSRLARRAADPAG
jgi:membrane protein DedA with SNARE-associated domain